jgi:hypothetical protein
MSSKKCIHEKRLYYCKDCGGKGICEHGKRRNICKDCGGASICEHGKRRNICKDCGGASICEHGKRRNICKDCGGSGICEHGKVSSLCKDCGGKGICEHGKYLYTCKDCGGKGICEHGKQRSYCKDCGGKGICEHGKQRSYCKDCGGSGICEHGKQRSYCKDCGGKGICEHGKQRSYCKDCGGASICEHEKHRSGCVICNPKIACIDCKTIIVNKTTQFYPLCEACYCVKNPDCEKSRHFKLKERILRDVLRTYFQDRSIELIFDRKVEGGCSLRRPDVLIDCELYSIVIECDENQHRNYECENKRTMQLFEDLGSRPLIMIRFNPDSYTDNKGVKKSTCFKPLTTGEDANRKRFYDIQEDEWVLRCQVLKGAIEEHLKYEDFPDQELTTIHLFYDSFNPTS